ncbi:hypothetical protein AVEN_161530-1, partial [Araneus ventricosus]
MLKNNTPLFHTAQKARVVFHNNLHSSSSDTERGGLTAAKAGLRRLASSEG